MVLKYFSGLFTLQIFFWVLQKLSKYGWLWSNAFKKTSAYGPRGWEIRGFKCSKNIQRRCLISACYLTFITSILRLYPLTPGQYQANLQKLGQKRLVSPQHVTSVVMPPHHLTFDQRQHAECSHWGHMVRWDEESAEERCWGDMLRWCNMPSAHLRMDDPVNLHMDG